MMTLLSQCDKLVSHAVASTDDREKMCTSPELSQRRAIPE